jgi:glycine cleavage system aminomethyltransferase T
MGNQLKTEKIFTHIPMVPYDPNVGLYFPERGEIIPYEYTNWRDEVLSWKKTCYIHASLCPSPTSRIKGPDALKFLSENCVNNMAKFPVGMGKHGIMCNEEGLVMCDGVVIRTEEDEFITNWMEPYSTYALQKGKYDAIGEDLTGKVFLFQVAGPNSLEVLETASGDDLRDIAFMHHRMTSIAGKAVRILRMGMAGSLAYELHGAAEDSHDVYNAIYEAGVPLGIRKLGYRAYMMNHTENGFPQAYYHFPYPWGEDKGFVEYLEKIGGGLGFGGTPLVGSMPPDIKLRYRNPVELGWSKMINFNHGFVGREALEKLVANPKRKMVTLSWNTEDIMDIHASQYEQGEPYPNIDVPSDKSYHGYYQYHDDQVLNKDGKFIGVSSGRTYSYYYREMISLSSIDVEYGDIGTEVTILWGDPGTRQKKIRATVTRFPFFDEGRNQDIDVTKIPRFAKK